jgi:predicted metal-binding membrane protein
VTRLESILRREHALTAIALGVLTLIAWVYVLRGAGMGMSALDMTAFTLFPHAQPEHMPDMAVPSTGWVTVVAMWWIMMIAMMMPSATPLILLYARVLRHAGAQSPTLRASPMILVSGYLAVWLAFSIAAAGIQYALLRAGLISAMMLWSKSAWLSAAVLTGAGLYQLSPLKHACLRRCRGPVGFLMRHSRVSPVSALITGIEHGAWCLGCCWMLMVLLFVGDVMNLVWIALLALFVLAEKVIPWGPAVSRISGVALIAWGIATLAV